MPQLVLLFLVYFGLTKAFGINLSGEVSSVIVFTVWGTAEKGDLVRGALQSIPKHQYESGEALGLGKLQVYWYIILPQTLRRLIPLAINLTTRMIKTTSLIVMIGVVEVLKVAQQLLERVGLLEKKDMYPRPLSGGQKQRVAIVRSLIMKPEMMLFDEVTAALDPEMVREVLDVMLELAAQGSTMMIVTHEMQFAKAVADRIIFLDGGEIGEEDAPKNFFEHPRTERARKFLNTFVFE